MSVRLYAKDAKKLSLKKPFLKSSLVLTHCLKELKNLLQTFVLGVSIAHQPFIEIKTHRCDRKVFQRLAVIVRSRTVDLRDILAHELEPVPLPVPSKSEWQYE